MRTYEFKCKECSKVFESRDRLAKIECCDMLASRLYSVGGISFKGSGFHKNDY